MLCLVFKRYGLHSVTVVIVQEQQKHFLHDFGFMRSSMANIEKSKCINILW